MSILQEKIELAKMVLDIEDESIIEQMKVLLLNQAQNLPPHVKESIDKSIEQANSGKLISLEEFKMKHFFSKS